jgi:hypothetical protein
VFGGPSGWQPLDMAQNPPEPPPPILPGQDPNAPAPGKGQKLDAKGKPVPGAKGGAQAKDAPAGGKGKPGAKDAKAPPAKGGAKQQPLKKFVATPVDPTDRPSVAKTERTATAAVAKALATVGRDVGHQVHRALLVLGKSDETTGGDAQEIAKKVADQISLDGLTQVSDAIEPALSKVAGDAGGEIVGQLGPTDTEELVNQVDLDTVQFARARAAELVGKRWTKDGELIDNPNPTYAITDATRDRVRALIADGLEKNLGSEAIGKAIREDAAAFGEKRAAVITHTEIARANVQGSLIGARKLEAGGVDLRKSWLISNLGCCDKCALNAAMPPISIDADFLSGDSGPPAHPNCRCSLGWHVHDPMEDGQG